LKAIAIVKFIKSKIEAKDLNRYCANSINNKKCSLGCIECEFCSSSAQ